MRGVSIYVFLIATVFTMIVACFVAGERLIHGAAGGAVTERVMLILDAADWRQVSACLLGLTLTVIAGMPMGFYLWGLMTGYYWDPNDY